MNEELLIFSFILYFLVMSVMSFILVRFMEKKEAPAWVVGIVGATVWPLSMVIYNVYIGFPSFMSS